MSDLEALLTGYQNTQLRQGMVSDFVGERWDPRTEPVGVLQDAKGFHRRFVKRSVPRFRAAGADPYGAAIRRGPLSLSDIWHFLHNDLRELLPAAPFDHDGATRVLGIPVYMAEPYRGSADGWELAARMATLFGFPVTFHEQAFHGHDTPVAERLVRYCIWYTFDSDDPAWARTPASSAARPSRSVTRTGSPARGAAGFSAGSTSRHPPPRSPGRPPGCTSAAGST